MIKALLIASDDCKSCLQWKPVFEMLMEEYNIEYEIADATDVKDIHVEGLPLTIFYDDNGHDEEITPVDELLGNYTEEYARERIEGLLTTCK